jgi:tetratricopeptide (TPR) repeat protein
MSAIARHNNKIGDNLTNDEVADLQEFGGLEWGPRDIAIALGFDIDQFTAEYNDPDSIVGLAIARGRLLTLVDVQKAVLTGAKAGDISSVAQLDKIRREKSFQASKLDIFGAFDDKKTFDRIYEYIAVGKCNELSNNEKLFLDLLTIINSFDRQFGKRATVKFLTQQLSFSYDTAVDYYNQADQLFYSNRNTTKEALRNKYADMLDDLGHAARNVATTSKDFDAAADIFTKAAKVRKLDEPEIQVLPAAMYPRPYRIFTLDPTQIGLPPINRQEIGQQIDLLQIPEADKQRLRRDALIEDVDFTELFDHGKPTQN